jgi:hypothetical protein
MYCAQFSHDLDPALKVTRKAIITIQYSQRFSISGDGGPMTFCALPLASIITT